MLVNEIPKGKVKYCMEHLQTLFDRHSNHDVKTLKLALTLYRNGAVFNVAVEGNTVKAVVLDDGDTYEVELELDFFEISFCDCQSRDTYCAHKLALLFYLFSLFDSPGEFFNYWRDGIDYTSNEKNQDLPKKTNLISPKKTERPYQEDELKSWLAFFNDKYEQFRNKRDARVSTYWNYSRNSNLAESIYEDYYPTLMESPLPSSPFGEILFHIHAAITVFEKLLEAASDRSVSMYSHNQTGMYLKELISDVIDLVFSIHRGTHKPTAADDKILSETPKRIMNLLFMTRDFQYDRFYLFQIFCTNLLTKNNWLIELERQLLARNQKEEKLKQMGKVNYSSECRLALAHFDFMVGNDQEAIKRLTDGPSNEVYYYTTWFKVLAQNKIWNRFETWLPFIEERMGDFIHQYGDQYLKRELTTFYLYFIREYANEMGSESLYISTLQTWLPYSYSDFCQYFLDKKEFRNWAELQLFAGISIENLDRELLKEIENEDRACLLPLYHNAVEEFITMKSRDAYRQAVKYLRKLRTHYRALKKEEVWENYIYLLASKYKRLRAFQEELRKGKGKLIND